MRILALFSYAVIVAGFAALLAGCGSAGSSPAPASGLAPGGVNPTNARFPRELNPAAFPEDVTGESAARAPFHPHRVWISPDITRSSRLLFVTSFRNQTLNVYSMPGMVVRGQVRSFTSPQGACADRTGQVWVVDANHQNITRWSRNLEMTGELDDRDGIPVDCAVDPKTGNLAVSNSYGSTGGAGNVVIYDHATGHGTPISNPEQYYYAWLGYDTSGNLWVDGTGNGGAFILSGCGASSCSTIHITGATLYLPGFVQWAAGQRLWYVADNFCGYTDSLCIYPVSASGAVGTPITLKDPTGHALCGDALVQGVITNARSRILAAGFDNERCGGVTGVARWLFPAGGAPTHDNDGGVFGPVGAAISVR